MPVTALREVSKEEFWKLFDASVHASLDAQWRREDVSHLVCFTCGDMWSSLCGHRTALAIGPSCTYKTMDESRENRLGDVPSRFQYPTEFVEKLAPLS